jgi:Raf kinase inhibitor-like YbhB/YbcL family protein
MVNCPRRFSPFFAALLSVVVLGLPTACQDEEPLAETGEVEMTLSSLAFQEGSPMPDRYTCQGEDVSPELQWSGPPAGTQSLALIMDDPDAPGRVFTHWVLFNLPPDIARLPEAVPVQPQLPDGSLQGQNDMGRVGYGGPCPPSGNAHHYQFTIYALDARLDLSSGASKKQVADTMQGHILAQGRLTGTYQR